MNVLLTALGSLILYFTLLKGWKIATLSPHPKHKFIRRIYWPLVKRVTLMFAKGDPILHYLIIVEIKLGDGKKNYIERGFNFFLESVEPSREPYKQYQDLYPNSDLDTYSDHRELDRIEEELGDFKSEQLN